MTSKRDLQADLDGVLNLLRVAGEALHQSRSGVRKYRKRCELLTDVLRDMLDATDRVKATGTLMNARTRARAVLATLEDE